MYMEIRNSKTEMLLFKVKDEKNSYLWEKYEKSGSKNPEEAARNGK